METTQKINIVQFAHWSRSGIISLIKTIASNNTIAASNKANFNFPFLLLESDEQFEDFYNDFPVKAQLFLSRGKSHAIREFRRFIAKHHPVIIHTHSLTPWILTSFFSRNSQIIFHLHCDYPYLFNTDTKSRLKQWLLWLCANRSNSKIISVSETSAARLQDITGKNVEYVPNGIPDNGLIRAPFEQAPATIKFYSVCRLDPEKNLTGAIQLLRQLSKRGHKLIYHIYGSGSQASVLEAQIRHEGLSEHIQLMGFHNSPQDLPAQYDFYLSTSTQEGLSLSALHALRGKTPIITTPVGQIGKVLQHGINGFLIGDDENSNIKILEDIFSLSGPELAQIQERGRKLFWENFTLDVFLSRIYNIYCTLTGHTAGAN